MTTVPNPLSRRLWRRARRDRREESPRGQALVEFALGLPLMLVIMLGTVDIGQVFLDYIALRNGCREAASYGARNPTDYLGMEERLFGHSPVLGSGTDWFPSYTGDGAFDPAITDRATVALTCSREFRPVTTNFLQSYFGLGPIQLKTVATAEILK